MNNMKMIIKIQNVMRTVPIRIHEIFHVNCMLYKLIIFGMIICFIAGCSTFNVEPNLKGKDIVYYNGFYLKEGNKLRKINVKKGRKYCSIIYEVQNKDKSAVALLVGGLEVKNFKYKNKVIKTVPIYILLVSGNDILYETEGFQAVSLQWISNNKLQITYGYEKVFINKKGKILSRLKFKENQLNHIPPESIH